MLLLHLVHHSSIMPIAAPAERQPAHPQVSMDAIRALNTSGLGSGFSLSFETIKNWISSVLETIRHWLFGPKLNEETLLMHGSATNSPLSSDGDSRASPVSMHESAQPCSGPQGVRFSIASERSFVTARQVQDNEDNGSEAGSHESFRTAPTRKTTVSEYESAVDFLEPIERTAPILVQEPTAVEEPTPVVRTPREEFERAIIQALGEAAGRALLGRVFNQSVQRFSQVDNQYIVEFAQEQKRSFKPETKMGNNTANSIKTPKSLAFTVEGNAISFAAESPLVLNATVKLGIFYKAADISIQSLAHNPSNGSITLAGAALGIVQAVPNEGAAFVQMINAII
jgi:hypothetical protein